MTITKLAWRDLVPDTDSYQEIFAHADWCVACKEFEKYTFSDPQVQKALADTVLLQANVTANDAQDVALLKHLNVLGLPTILFFDGQGQEHPQARVTGFMDAETFSAHLRDRQP